MDSSFIRQQILDELAYDPSLDASKIAVAVSDGVATLAGSVDSYAAKVSAEHAAFRVRGVHGVAQELKVVFPASKKTDDDQIAKRALDIIAWDTSIPDDKIRVKVQAGWLTLTGDVEWQFQKIAAETAVRKLGGVTGVSNLITVKPSVTANDIKARVEDALQRNAALEANAIRVSVAGNVVTLEGRVHAWSERGIAEQTAWSAPGVTAVTDRIQVV